MAIMYEREIYEEVQNELERRRKSNMISATLVTVFLWLVLVPTINYYHHQSFWFTNTKTVNEIQNSTNQISQDTGYMGLIIAICGVILLITVITWLIAVRRPKRLNNDSAFAMIQRMKRKGYTGMEFESGFSDNKEERNHDTEAIMTVIQFGTKLRLYESDEHDGVLYVRSQMDKDTKSPRLYVNKEENVDDMWYLNYVLLKNMPGVKIQHVD